MLQFSQAAVETVNAFLEGHENRDELVLKIEITGEQLDGFIYEFSMDNRKNVQPGDQLIEQDGFKVVIAEGSVERMQGAEIDWGMGPAGPDFQVKNPNFSAPEIPGIDPSDPLAQRVREVIERDINPSVAMHGGSVELVGVDNGKVFVRLAGGCHGCGMAQVTLKQGIETMIKEAIPEISEVIDTTNHTTGENPYFAS